MLGGGAIDFSEQRPATDLRRSRLRVHADTVERAQVDVTALDAGYGRAVARGARPVMPPGPSPEPGVRMAYVTDPEGNLIELLHRPPVA